MRPHRAHITGALVLALTALVATPAFAQKTKISDAPRPEPAAAQPPVPLPIEVGKPLAKQRGVPRPMLAGPPPAGVTVSGTPALARVTWGLVGASSYSVQRWMQSNPDCCRVSSPQLGAAKTEWNNPVPLSGTYVYRVTAVYPDGRQGYVDVNYVRPEPTNPAALTAMHLWSMPVSAGIAPFYYIIVVNVAWTPVPGAAYYVLWGPGLPTTGRTMEETQIQLSSGSPGVVPLKWGVNTWTVGAFFIPGPVSTAAANFTRGSVNVSEPKKP